MAGLSQQPVLCSVGVRLSAALWMWFSDLRDVSVAICRAWRYKYGCVRSWNTCQTCETPEEGSLCELHTASASCSSHIISYLLPRVRSKYLLSGKQIYLLPAAQLLRRSWHRELLYPGDSTGYLPSECLWDSGKRNSFLPGVQSCPPGLVAAASVPSTSLFTWSPWGQGALARFPAS